MKNESASLTTAQGDSVVLRSVHAQGHLDGLLLSMTLRQVFRNDTKKNLEVTYTFPLAWGAVLLGMQATLGGKRMSGQVMARREARERYEEAVEKGDAPIMVEKAQGGVFSASLGSLKPGEEAVIEIAYAQMLSFEQGRIRLVVPTTIAPRYGDPVRQGKLQPDQVAAPDLLAEHGFALSIRLTGQVAQARIGSPSHGIAQQREGDAVSVSLQGQAWLDRDFVLLLEGLEGRSFALAGPDMRSGEGHVAMIASYCPALPEVVPAPLRLKILVDCSGSMAGESIEQARNALRPMADLLRHEDRVSYSRFGDRTVRRLEPVDCTPRNVQALVDAINETNADLGGTEMAAALADTFAVRMGAAHHAEEADVLVITDGEVWDAQAIVDSARRSGHRVYALGVGSAPAESLLREMAEATGGACEFAAPHEDMAQAIQRLLARIRGALPIQAHLETQGKPLWSSPLPRRLAAGETVHLFLRLPARPAQAPALQLSSHSATPAELSLREDDLVARLVAAREIGATADKAQARERAERYQLVTEGTNLLLVIERAEADKTDGMPALHQVRPMLAAGWGGTGRAAASVQVLRFSRFNDMDDNIPFSASASAMQGSGDYGGLNVPSVWRANRTTAAAKVDALHSPGMGDDEIPAFLRKQAGDTAAPASRGTRPANKPAATVERARVAPATATPAQIVQAFNQAARQGQAFRPTLRAITDLPLETSLCQAIVDAGNHVGGPLRAWACYLLWLHDGGHSNLQLTPDALALAIGMVKGIDTDAREGAVRAFEALPTINPGINHASNHLVP